MAAGQRSDALVAYTRRIVELERELDMARREQGLSEVQRRPQTHTQPDVSPLLAAAQRNEETIARLEARLKQGEAVIRESQETAERLVDELTKQQQELNEVVRSKDREIAALKESLAQLQGRGNYPPGDVEASLRSAQLSNEALRVDLHTAQAECSRLQLQYDRLLTEHSNTLPRHTRLSVSPTTNVTVYPRPGSAHEWVKKGELCGVQEDFGSLYRRYVMLRDEKGVSEEAVRAVSRVREMEEDMEQARELVAQLRHDIEALLGWRVEFYGSSILLTMKYSSLSLELVRNTVGLSPEYRLAPSFLLRKALQHPEATHYLTQSKSFPAFLACLLLDYTGNTQLHY